jgi:hypothetical protein
MCYDGVFMTDDLAQLAMALSFAVPSFAMGFRLLAVWRDPLSIDGGRWVRYGVGLFVLEFILLHAGVMLGGAAAASGGGFAGLTLLLLGFYALFAGAIALGFRDSSLFQSFLLVIGGRALGSLLGISTESQALFLAHSLIGMVLYFAMVMASVVIPWPRRGITEAIAAEQRVPGSSGLWVEKPHRAIGPAAIYYLLLGLAEVALLTWIDAGNVVPG